jgi:menaquinone-9 beta-reductase
LTYDLIIVGAGPSGSSATLYAKRAGLSTLLLDKAQFPRDKICGDALGGKAVAILRELDLLEKIKELPGVLVRNIVFGSPNHVEAKIELDRARRRDFVTGFVIRRAVFDDFLFQHAREAATDCIQGFTVDDVILDNKTAVGVRGRDATGAVREFFGRIIVGADGYRSSVAQSLGLYSIDPKHWIFALRRYYKGVKGLTDRIELHYVADCMPGYFWIFPLENGLANIGIGMIVKDMNEKKRNLVRVLDEVIQSRYFASRFAGAEPIEKAVGWHLPVGSKRRRCHGSGYLLLGDAAGLIDPFTGEGIANAMYSARKAVEIARLALAENDVSEPSLSRYDTQIWDEIGDELAVSTKLQRIARFKPLLNYTIGKAARNANVRDTICAMIAQEVPRKQLTSPLFYLKLLAS